MKTFTSTLCALLTIPALSFSVWAQDAPAAVKTSFNDAAQALSDKQIGDLFPMYDAQVNQILRICAKGGNIPAAVDGLIGLGVNFGNEIDAQEESILIRASKVNVTQFAAISKGIIVNLKKSPNTSIEEAGVVIDQLDKGEGDAILKGIQTLAAGSYRMRTGAELILNKEKLELWSAVGKMEPGKFQELYASLQQVGLEKELNETNTKAIMELVKENSNPEILHAVSSLKMASWRCEGELDTREVKVISSLIHQKYTEESAPVAIEQHVTEPMKLISEKRASIE